MKCTPDRFEEFIHANTALAAPPHVPEIGLHLADEAHDLWQRTEEELAEIGLPPPFWAFAWAGGQGLARYVLDNPGHGARQARARLRHRFRAGRHRRGEGGAAHVIAADIDPFCAAAVRLNAAANGVEVAFDGRDFVGADDGFDVLLAGDVFYDKPSPIGWCRGSRALRQPGRRCSSAIPAAPICRANG